VRAAQPLPAAQSQPGRWSFGALVLAGAGVTASTWLAVTTDGDPGRVLWTLVLAPLAITIAPVLAPRGDVRWAATAAMAIWCVIAATSIGLLLVPALVAQLGAALREDG